MSSITDTMVCHTSLREIICTNFCRTVTSRNEALSAISDIIDIFLMLTVIYICTQACKRALLIFRLVTRFSTLDEDFLCLASIRILPHISSTYTRFHLIYVLTTCTRRAESVPFDFTLVDSYFERIRLWKNCYRCSTGLHTSVRFSNRNALYAMNTRFIFQYSVNVDTTDSEIDFLESADSTFADISNREIPSFCLAITLVHLEEISSEKASFIATSSGTNFHLYILCVFRILRNKSYFDFLFELRLQFFIFSQLLASYLFHVRIRLIHHNILSL